MLLKECCYRIPKKKGRSKGSKNKPKGTISDNKSGNNQSSSSSSSSSDSPPQHSNFGKVVTQPIGNAITPYPDVRRFESNRHSVIVDPLGKGQDFLLNDVIKRRTIDTFFDVVSFGTDIFTKEHLEKMVFEHLSRPEDFDNEQDSYLRSNSLQSGARAFWYSIQAVCDQRMGSKAAELSYREARKNLGQAFDSLDNGYVKAAYAFLASYLAGEGDDFTSNFFLKSLEVSDFI